MVGSPNFRRLVYDGDAEGVPAGSEVIERVLADQLRRPGLAVGETALGGGSDHACSRPPAFRWAGCSPAPASQGRTGPEAFGGDTGPTDLSYYDRCDDLDNLDLNWDQMADAATASPPSPRPGPSTRAC